MEKVYCKKGKYSFGLVEVVVETLAFIIPWRNENDIFKNQYQVQQVADLIERVYIYEKCFGGNRHEEFIQNEGAYTKQYSQENLMGLKNEFIKYIATFDYSIDKEDNLVVFDRRPWQTELDNGFDTGEDRLKMSRQLGAKLFAKLPDLTGIDNK